MASDAQATTKAEGCALDSVTQFKINQFTTHDMIWVYESIHQGKIYLPWNDTVVFKYTQFTNLVQLPGCIYYGVDQMVFPGGWSVSKIACMRMLYIPM